MNGDPVRPVPKPVREKKPRKWLKRKRPTPRRSERVRDPAYLAWLHTLECCIPVAWPGPTGIGTIVHRCEGSIEADHVGRRPLGRKCSDRECVPLCRWGHQCRTERRGYFADRSAEWWEKWRVETPARYYAAFLSAGGRRGR